MRYSENRAYLRQMTDRLAALFFLLFLFVPFSWHMIGSARCGEPPKGVPQDHSQSEEEQTSEERPLRKMIPFTIKEKITVSAERMNSPSKDEYLLEGFVDIVSGRFRIQADRVYLNERTKECHAEGSVLLDWGENRLAGEKLEFDLETENGVIYSVLGYIEPEYTFTAERVEKIAEDVLVIHKGVFTTCTQPTPYWSLKVGRARVHLDHYAHLRNVLFKVRRLPIVYLPYLVWPVKEDRAAGLLFPEVGSTNNRGKVISEAFFWPIRRNMDVTFYADYYSLAGIAGGIEYNFVPNQEGKGRFLGYYLNDKITDARRYNFNYSQEQNFPKDFRLTADINEVSDFNYYIDFERDLRLSSKTSILSRLNLSRNWSSYSFNSKGERRKQLLGINQLEQSILPEIELRGRSRKLWNSPFYLSFESSIGNFSKQLTSIVPIGDDPTAYDYSYLRYDLFPTLSAPYSPFPWLDLNPSIQFRETYYTKKLMPGESGSATEVIDDSINRFLFGGTLEVIGPKFYKVFERPKSGFSPRYKHSIEPRIVYSYMPTFDRNAEVLRFDEIDQVRGGNIATLYFRNALYAKRPSGPEEKTKEKGAEKAAEEDQEAPEEKKEKSTATNLIPVEIASFEISQSYSFDFPLSFGQGGESKNSSPIAATMRFNPGTNYSFDLRATYDTIYKTLRSSSISTSLKKDDIGFLTLNMIAMNGVGGAQDNEQVTFEGGTFLLNRKLGLNAKLSYNFSKSFMPEQRYRIEYYTQCCGFYFEYLNRDFSTNERREFRFAIDLKGIGKVIDFHEGFNR